MLLVHHNQGFIKLGLGLAEDIPIILSTLPLKDHLEHKVEGSSQTQAIQDICMAMAMVSLKLQMPIFTHLTLMQTMTLTR